MVRLDMMMNKNCLAILVAAAMMLELAVSQNCGCAPYFCCSRWGYCGFGYNYCGTGCQEGPCWDSIPRRNDFPILRFVTDRFFDLIASQAGSNCEGVNFYTRQAFVDALRTFPAFGRVGTWQDSIREVAAFFAHVTCETEQFCHINDKPSVTGESHCDGVPAWPCAPNKSYFGRGPLKLTGNSNYGAAGEILRENLLNRPELVARNPVTSFKAALWQWMYRGPHTLINTGHGFGSTIYAPNNTECDGFHPDAIRARVGNYTLYCSFFGVQPGDKLTCGSQPEAAADPMKTSTSPWDGAQASTIKMVEGLMGVF